MKPAKVCFCALLAVLFAWPAQAQDVQALYQTLDSAIEQADQYQAVAENRHNRLRQQLAAAAAPERRYDLSMQLFEEYKSYNSDSALAYAARCVELGREMKQPDKAGLAQARMAFQCSTAGLYNEALEILGALDTTGLSRETMCAYYLAAAHVNGELGYYGKVDKLRGVFYARRDAFNCRLESLLDHESDDYLQIRESALRDAKRYDEALKVNDRRLALCDEGSRHFAIVAFYRYVDYSLAGDAENARIWLLRSAIADVQNAVLDQGSLWELANQMLGEKDLTRPYSYINFAWDCANRFSSRVRHGQVLPILSIVNKMQAEQTERANRQLWLFAGIILVLLLVILGALLYLNRQRKKLAVAHSDLRLSNRKLSEASEQVSKANAELNDALARLRDTNSQLSGLNVELTEANRVKDEYLGRFMQLCSQYVDKMEQMRATVSKMVKNRKFSELQDMMRATEFRDRELGELYSTFDKAFLHLFPQFIDEFNALVKPEERAQPFTEEEGLPTTVRIFALIRLGIEDSSKIAVFLHYSVNTIYNYRARVKNAALGNRNEFEDRIKSIGMVK